jgi:hypothetical protein
VIAAVLLTVPQILPAIAPSALVTGIPPVLPAIAQVFPLVAPVFAAIAPVLESIARHAPLRLVRACGCRRR